MPSYASEPYPSGLVDEKYWTRVVMASSLSLDTISFAVLYFSALGGARLPAPLIRPVPLSTVLLLPLLLFTSSNPGNLKEFELCSVQ